MMQVNDCIHGFRVWRVRPVQELRATLYEMRHEASGAQLLWLDRPDENKTFAIGFKTLPEDDTGVFHILEHSVLCGSDKYPVKEPFVELLKSSLQTFLNAFTFPDKTVYPVCSRNEQDFVNLVRVYMDAVLHPVIYHKPEIFRQEGWHYEITSPEQQPTFKGVVFNEMKGAFASVEELLMNEMNRLLFPDNCYRFVSGGDPEHIPELTYEKFLDNHRKFYHPSNARIALDGQMDIDRILALLDEEYLGAYTVLDADFTIPLQGSAPYRESMGQYEIGENEDPANKTMVQIGYLAGTFADQKQLLAARILADYLAGNNEAPLKRALLAAGLAQDVQLGLIDDLQQPYLALQVMNTEADKLPAIKDTLRQVLTQQVQGGMDKQQLAASCASLSFSLLAQDTSWAPIGLLYALQMYGTWLYDGDPAQNLSNRAVLEQLAADVDTQYYEQLLDQLMLSNPHTALVCLSPSATLGEQTARRESQRLAEAKARWSEAEVADLVEMNRRQLAWQETPDSPEALATIPVLRLSEVSPQAQPLPLTAASLNGLPVLYHEVNTNGILYFSLYFKATDLPLESLPLAGLLGRLLGELPTAQHDSATLQMLVKRHIGSLSFRPEVYTLANNREECLPYFVVDCSCLERERQKALSLVGEILTQTLFSDQAVLVNILRQSQMAVQMDFVNSGHRYAITRLAAYQCADGAAREALGGYSWYVWLKGAAANGEAENRALLAQLEELYRALLRRERLTVSSTAAGDAAFTAQLQALVPTGGALPAGPARYAPLAAKREGIAVPAGVAFAAQGSNLAAHGIPFHGSFYVLSSLLSLSHLWNTVRVQGGAYGTGFNGMEAGSMYFYSYRDPNPRRSLDQYAAAEPFLKEFLAGNPALDKFILGSLSDFEPLLGVQSSIKQAAGNYLRGKTYADVCRLRSELLSTTPQQLLAWCEALEAIQADDYLCVVGGAEKLDTCADRLEQRLSL